MIYDYEYKMTRRKTRFVTYYVLENLVDTINLLCDIGKFDEQFYRGICRNKLFVVWLRCIAISVGTLASSE